MKKIKSRETLVKEMLCEMCKDTRNKALHMSIDEYAELIKTEHIATEIESPEDQPNEVRITAVLDKGFQITFLDFIVGHCLETVELSWREAAKLIKKWANEDQADYSKTDFADEISKNDESDNQDKIDEVDRNDEENAKYKINKIILISAAIIISAVILFLIAIIVNAIKDNPMDNPMLEIFISVSLISLGYFLIMRASGL